MICNKLKLARAIAVAGVVALGAMAASAQAQTKIRLGHVGEPGSLMDASANEFTERVNEKLGDDFMVEAYGSSQLGNDTEMLRKLKLGTIDLALPSTVMSSVDPAYAVFELPFLISSRDQVTRIHEDDTIRGTLSDVADAHGYKLLGFWENGFRHITNSKRPIEKPEDLAGIKLRTPNGEWRVRMFKLYNANPTPMPYSETFVGLQTGAVDGQENPLAQIYPAHFYEVQKYLTLSRHVYTPVSVLAGASWKRLPEEVQDIIAETVVEMQPVALEQGAQMDEDLLVKLKEKGMEVNEIDLDAFIEASKPVYELFEESVDGGQALLDRIQSLQE